MAVSHDGLKKSQHWQGLRFCVAVLSAATALGVACSDDDSETAECIGGEGAVAGENENHCIENGVPVENPIGACMTGAPVDEEAGEDHEEGAPEEEEEHPVLLGREADDDNCKYHVRFENTCVALNEPVTFTLQLTRLFDDQPGSGTTPAYPEIFLADDAAHISPSNNITATEGPAGTYEIGPVVFDRSGRWVVRFHYFENCSEVAEDTPHSHVAFYIDVP
jgi:hypothetical protein